MIYRIAKNVDAPMPPGHRALNPIESFSLTKVLSFDKGGFMPFKERGKANPTFKVKKARIHIGYFLSDEKPKLKTREELLAANYSTEMKGQCIFLVREQKLRIVEVKVK